MWKIRKTLNDFNQVSERMRQVTEYRHQVEEKLESVINEEKETAGQKQIHMEIEAQQKINPKTGGWRRWFHFDTPPPLCCFSKNVSSKERVKPYLFVTLNTILRYIFPKNSIEFPQVVQKI